eukprot:PhM_4_TR13966/c0_g1_i1/m.91663
MSDNQATPPPEGCNGEATDHVEESNPEHQVTDASNSNNNTAPTTDAGPRGSRVRIARLTEVLEEDANDKTEGATATATTTGAPPLRVSLSSPTSAMKNETSVSSPRTSFGQGRRRSSAAAALPVSPRTRRQSYYKTRDGLPVDFVIETLQEKVVAHRMYSDLLIFIPFVIIFVFFFLGGRDVEANYFAIRATRALVLDPEWPTTASNIELFNQQVAREEPIQIDPDKHYMDIGNAGDWLTWFKESMIQNTFDCANPNVSHTILAPMGQNYHVGALRVRTMRVTGDSCDLNSDLVNESRGIQCFGGHKRSREQTGDFCGVPYEDEAHRLGATTTAREGVYHPGGYTVIIPFNSTCESARAVADALKGCGFVDNFATRFVMVEYFFYTPQFDTFHSVKLYSEVLPGGAWLPQYKFRSFPVRTSSYEGQTVLEFVFLLFVFYYIVRYFVDMFYAFRAKELGAYMLDFFNFLELSNLAVFVTVFVFRWQWWALSDDAHIVIPYKPNYPYDLDDIMVVFDIQVYANSVNTILTFLKLLKYVRVNARLSVLTKTMAECQTSILGVLVLFGFVITGYGITGVTLYGANVENYRSLGVSISTLMRMLVGDFDYFAMYEVNRYLTAFFFWSFVIIALFLLLNFVIAILSEAFAKVSGKAYAEPLDQAIVKEMREWRHLLHPDNLKAMARLLAHGHTPGAMIALCVQDLQTFYDAESARHELEKQQRREQRRKEKKLEDGYDYEGYDVDVDDDEEAEEEATIPLVYPASWTDHMRSEVTDGLGPHYMKMLWEMLIHDFEDAKKSCEEVDRKEVADTVKEGVSRAVSEEVQKIDRFDEALSELERNVTILMGKYIKSTQ